MKHTQAIVCHLSTHKVFLSQHSSSDATLLEEEENFISFATQNTRV